MMKRRRYGRKSDAYKAAKWDGHYYRDIMGGRHRKKGSAAATNRYIWKRNW